jgi:hypothetical protein
MFEASDGRCGSPACWERTVLLLVYIGDDHKRMRLYILTVSRVVLVPAGKVCCVVARP